MTDAERVRIGRRLKALRVERSLEQIPAAIKAAISVGTLQAIEYGERPVKDSNLEKYAQIFGTSITKLLKADDLSPTDPRLIDLNDEHLDIARSYMRATRRVRQVLEVLLLSKPVAEDALANLFLKLHALPPERVTILNRYVTAAPDLFPILEQVMWRMISDPKYAAHIREGLAVFDQHPLPTATSTKPATTHKRRAK